MKTYKEKSLVLDNGRVKFQYDGSVSISKCGSKVYIKPEDFDRIIRAREEESLQFPELPKGESYHNPDNITPEQVEVDKGWRLLTESEQKTISLYTCAFQVDCEGWWSDGWKKGYEGHLPGMTYRTKAGFPFPKLSVSDKDQYGDKKTEISPDIDLIGRRHTAAFLRKCRVIVLENPMDEPDPFGIPGKLIVLNFGKKEGWGEINPDMEFESYLDGKTFKLRNLISVTP